MSNHVFVGRICQYAIMLFFLCIIDTATAADRWKLKPTGSDLSFSYIPHSWDEGIPLGNGVVGALVWQKGNHLRFSLDRTDLWDLRPTDSLSGKNYRFDWVKAHIRSKDYLPVQKKMDWPYDRDAAPSKIPGAAIEFAVDQKVKNVRLYLHNALCRVEWQNGMVLNTFVQADRPIGWFVFERAPKNLNPILVPPQYERGSKIQTDPVTGQDLSRLGYRQGVVKRHGNTIVYRQYGWNGFYYDVAVRWQQIGNRCVGVWCVTSAFSNQNIELQLAQAWERNVGNDYSAHLLFWNKYWKQSSVTLPDSILQRQYDNEMYKLGSASREHSYPISLQAVWTADNGKLPPWKGDFHHDLNTELSYWPVYAGNHLSEGMGYLNTLWNQRDVYRKFTKVYFGHDGLNVPGVCTLTGDAMGGWIQYSLSQTTAAWLAQHFYLHWKYSSDSQFLRNRAYPFVKEVAHFLEQQLTPDDKGKLRLEFSSTPEMFDNSLQAWFLNMTNYDLSLIRFLMKAATEMADALSLSQDALHWKSVYDKLPDFNFDENGALTFAKGTPYRISHRHFSHAMSIYPLGLIDWEDGEQAQHIIRSTIATMEKAGPDWWTGYSYAWFACMKARARDGEGAAKCLLTFARCFCLPNTFHVNGDQSGTGKSKFNYRPFTLEGNFAFAAGIQEMLMQSQKNVIRLFPAIPSSWKNVSFDQLRAQGAFLVSATLKNGKLISLRVKSERGNVLRIISPVDGKLMVKPTKVGESIELIK